MADNTRSVRVVLVANVGDFIAGMDRSAKATRETTVAAAAQAAAVEQAANARAVAAEKMIAAAEAERVAQLATAEAVKAAAAEQAAAATAAADASAENVAAAQAASAAAVEAAARETAARQAAAVAAGEYTAAQVAINEAAEAGAAAATARVAAVEAEAAAQAAAATSATAAAAAIQAAAVAQAEASAENIASSQAAALAATQAGLEESAASARAATAAQTAAAAQVRANELAAAASASMASTTGAAAVSGTALASATTKVGGSMVALGAVAALGVGVAVKSFADFDEQMSAVQAATHASSEEMGKLRDAAMEAGAKTRYSSTEAGQGIEEMAKAGVSTTNIIGGGLMGALNLAASGSMSVADAAGVAATTLVQFGLSGKDIPHVADLLAAGANKAMGSVQDLSEALKFVGPVAAGMNVSVEETTGTLAAFASQGLIGEQAGTGLRGILSSLTSPSKQAGDEIQRLGLHLYDAQGNFLGLANVAGELGRAYKPMTDAQRDASLGILFGNAQVTDARVLYKEGAQGINEWTKAVDASGYATQTASMKMDNLKGDVSNLGSSLENTFIEGGSAANGVLRDLAEGATVLVNAVGKVSGPEMAVVVATGALTAAIGLSGGAALLAVPKLVEYRAAMATLSTGAQTTAKGIGMLGKAGAGIAVGTAALAGFDALVQSQSKSVVTGTDATTSAVLKLGTNAHAVDAIIAKASDGADFNFKNLADAAKAIDDPSISQHAANFNSMVFSLGGHKAPGLEAVKAQIGTVGDALGGLVADGHAEQANAAFNSMAATWTAGGHKLSELKALMPGYTEALAAASNKQAEVGGTAGAAAGGVQGVGDAAAGAAPDVEKLADAIDALFGRFYSVQQASDAFQSKLLELADATKGNGNALDGNTKGAIANREAVIDLVRAADDQIQAMEKQGASAGDVASASASMKAQIIEAAKAAGFNADEVNGLVAQLDEVPGTYQATVSADTSGATSAVDAFITMLSKVPKHLVTTVGVKSENDAASYVFRTTPAPTPAQKLLGGTNTSLKDVGNHADGGLLSGPGGPREDNLIAHVSAGEFIVNAAATSQHQPLLETINAGKFADGGRVGGQSALALASGGLGRGGPPIALDALASSLCRRAE